MSLDRGPSRFGRLSASDMGWEALRVLTLVVALFIVVPPILYMLSISIRPVSEWPNPYYIVPPPGKIQVWHYVEAMDILSWMFKNSYLRAMGSAVIGLILSVPAAYTIARRRFPFRRTLFWSMVSVRLFPLVVVVVPMMVITFELGINDKLPTLWIADQLFIIPFAVWLLREFFNSMPPNLEESAQVYGCTEFEAFVRVILPLTIPGILAVGFLAFVHGWKEYIYAQLLTGQHTRVAIINLTKAGGDGPTHWGIVMAKVVILSVPPLILYGFARKSIQNAFAFD